MQKNKRGDIEKWDQTDSTEVPDRGETSPEVKERDSFAGLP